ncbi:MAG: DUF1648 domain-containing protein, partial [Maribacter sp.]|nr:DUF1648 domain-containing protein [Maribacter sp.]
MKNRPKITLELNKSDKIIEIVGWIGVCGIWVLTLITYSKLPETIPIHYNASGEVDGYGDKTNILALPVIATVLFLGLTVLNKFPHLFNYPFSITENNALKHYSSATRMIRLLKFAIVVVFGLIIFKTIQNVNGTTDGLGSWFLPLTLG